MDEWDPYSEISMFNNLDGYGNKLDIMTKRDVCYEFEKLMTRYIYLEKVVNEYKTEKKKRKRIFVLLTSVLIVMCSVFYAVCIYIPNVSQLSLEYINHNYTDTELLYLP